jgi:hypothetical protein
MGIYHPRQEHNRGPGYPPLHFEDPGAFSLPFAKQIWRKSSEESGKLSEPAGRTSRPGHRHTDSVGARRWRPELDWVASVLAALSSYFEQQRILAHSAGSQSEWSDAVAAGR